MRKRALEAILEGIRSRARASRPQGASSDPFAALAHATKHPQASFDVTATTI